jgi:hypothetical protein
MECVGLSDKLTLGFVQYLEQLLSLNDLINNVLKRYDNISKGIFTRVEEAEPDKTT